MLRSLARGLAMREARIKDHSFKELEQSMHIVHYVSRQISRRDKDLRGYMDAVEDCAVVETSGMIYRGSASADDPAIRQGVGASGLGGGHGQGGEPHGNRGFLGSLFPSSSRNSISDDDAFGDEDWDFIYGDSVAGLAKLRRCVYHHSPSAMSTDLSHDMRFFFHFVRGFRKSSTLFETCTQCRGQRGEGGNEHDAGVLQRADRAVPLARNSRRPCPDTSSHP